METLLQETLNKMPNLFTSNLFIKSATVKGLQPDAVKDHSVFNFLLANCNRGKSIREWSKKKPYQTSLITPELTEDAAILFLKSKGYRISKMVEV